MESQASSILADEMNHLGLEPLKIPPSLKFLMSNLKSIVTIKLTADNFPVWRSQVLKLVTANDYQGFLDGTACCPNPSPSDSADGLSASSTVTTWRLIDQNLCAALLSTLSESVLPHVVNLDSCHSVWITLQRRLQPTNRSKVMQLKHELHNIKKLDKSMSVYLSELKSLVDGLTAAEGTLDSEDVIHHILNGLPSTYNPFKTAIRTMVGRMAGQFAKPRSEPFETINGVKLPTYQGDNINNDAFNEEARKPDPKRLIRAYSQSAVTLNLLRAFSTGGYASIQKVTQWNLDFVEHSEQGDRYMELAQRVDDAIGFMVAAGLTADHPIMRSTEFWTSHECLHLPYEQALTREDSTTGHYYDFSAHMLWVGERTRQLDGAHVEFLRGASNPLGVKVSDKMDPSQLVKFCEILNPHNKPGSLTIIARMGAKNLRIKLPHLIRAVRQAGLIVTWVSDPMHGNTMKAPCGLKTRSFDAIISELRAFFNIHEQEGSHPGGVHLEMTGQNVTECIGGSKTVTFDDLSSRYHTHCDPRLNASQSLELAFAIAEWLRKRRAISWNDWVFDDQLSTAVV